MAVPFRDHCGIGRTVFRHVTAWAVAILGVGWSGEAPAVAQPTGAPAGQHSEGDWRTHPPTRPLPQAIQRPLGNGPLHVVDAARGDDANPGTLQQPWRSLEFAVTRLQPGDTLCLRGGIYHERVRLECRGEPDRPITIRSYPGELAIVDGGLPEFLLAPQTAWEPHPEGVPGEFRSVRRFPDLGGGPNQTNLLGNFAESMVPLHGYRFLNDLRSDNPYWNISSKSGGDESVYCGPGLYYDVESQRIHVRLASTRLPGLGSDNYRGETDPRKTPLVVAGFQGGSVLSLQRCAFVRLQDLVLRGSREATLNLERCFAIELSGMTIYGGSRAVQVQDTQSFRMSHSACRGIAAPWTFRGSLKYRAIEARIFSASGWMPSPRPHRDFEIAYSEFTDSVDGVFLGNVPRVRFHHNLIDNISDDGMFLTATTGYDGTTPGGDVHIYQNVLRRCLTTFAFGVGHGRQKSVGEGKQTGAGVYIFRNVFDFRRPVMYQWPSGPDAPQEISSMGRVASDHGGPAWEPMYIYHNTVLAGDPPRYDYGTDGFGSSMGGGTRRRVFNNVVVQMQGMVGQSLPDSDLDFIGDANVFWTVDETARENAELFSRWRNSEAYAQSRRNYPPGWTTHDRFVDPGFREFNADWDQPVVLRPTDTSPLIDAAVELPDDWPRLATETVPDPGRPDVGAFSLQTQPWRVGMGGRLTANGAPAAASDPLASVAWQLPWPDRAMESKATAKVALVKGYPAFDAPLLEFALRKAGAEVVVFEKEWLPVEQFQQFDAVVFDGSLTRGKVVPDRFSEEDLPVLEKYVRSGGKLVLMRERTDLFRHEEGQKLLAQWVRQAAAAPRPKPVPGQPDLPRMYRPEHPWIAAWQAAQIAAQSSLHGSKGAKPPTTKRATEPDLDLSIRSKDAAPKSEIPLLENDPRLALKASEARDHAARLLPTLAAPSPLRAATDYIIVGQSADRALLLHADVGRGEIIYVGWLVSGSLPHGRKPSTDEMETNYELQFDVLTHLASHLTQSTE